MDFLTSIFDSSDWVPRWQCGRWTALLGWLHIAADMAVWAAYLTIPVVLWTFVQRRRDLPFPKIFWIFGAFIFLCGTTHLVQALIFWWPVYRLSALVTLATAVVSWATVAALFVVVPRALNMPGLARADALQREERNRRAAEEALREREARLRAILGTAVDGIITIDERGQVDSLNQAAERLFGYAADEVIGRNVSMLMPSPYRDEHDQYMENYRRTGVPKIIGIGREVLGRRKDGSVFPLDLAVSEVKLGTRRLFTGIVRDITERKRLETHLRQEREHLQNVLDSLFAFVGVLTPDGTLTSANRAALEAAGLRAADVVGRPFEQTYWWSYAPEVQAQLREAIARAARGEPSRYDVDVRVAPDRLMTIDFMLAPMVAEDGRITHLVPSAIDITERKRAEAASAENEAKLQAILDNMPAAAYAKDRAGRYVLVNRNVLQLFGRRREAVLGRTDFELFAGEQAERYVANDRQVLASGQPQEFEETILVPSGVRTYLSIKFPLRLRGGEPYAVCGISADITERKRTEAVLRESEEWLKLSLRAAAAGTWELDLRTGRLKWSEECYRLQGLDPGVPATVESWAAALHPEDRDLVLDRVQRASAAGDPGRSEVDLVYRVLRGEETCWVQARGRVLFDSRGPARMRGVLTDITERKQAELGLRESEERFRMLADSAPVLIWMSNRKNEGVYYNRKWLEFTGRPLERELGCGWQDSVHPDDRAMLAEWADGFRARRPFTVQFRMRRADGAWRWLLNTGVPRTTADGRFEGFIGSGVDITEHKRIEAERAELLTSERTARSEAERISRLKDEFLATLSHELRTPLNAILGWSQLLLRGRLSAEVASEGLRTIERNARAQAALINDLLDMSRIISGKVLLDVQPVDLRPVVEAALDTVRPAAQAKDMRLETRIGPGACLVRGDANRLQQILWNLLSNAIKFTPRGGQVQVDLARVNSHLELRVADTGIGIPPAFLPHVFERFRQFDGSTTREQRGLGLGLSIVRHLVELHGGAIDAHSAGEGSGATFTIRLPVAAVHPATVPAGAAAEGASRRPPEPGAPHAALGGLRVLTVDDEPDARELIRRVLEEHGAEVRSAASADEALTLLAAEVPDVLVSDIGMPHRDGYDLLRAVRALPAERGGRTPAVALTAFARPEDRVSARQAGFDEHLAKPVDAAELLGILAALAERARAGAGPLAGESSREC